MRICRLVLHGFKSFPIRTTLEFGSGISGIVGPNGCGKSNVVDALRWVLGESSARSLRGSEMMDVIFGGSVDFPPLSTCEVRLVFTAEGSEPFPGAYAANPELELCRRTHRDGGSEYEINGTRVRRRDVVELLLDGGIGPQHAFVEQGRVDRLVHATPVERRLMLDDAAGVSAWRVRRDEALARLTGTAAQLDRAADLATELRRQVVSMRESAIAAARWRRWRAVLRLNEIAVSLVRFDERTADRRVLRDRVRAAGADRDAAVRDVARREADLGARRAELALAELAATTLRDELHAADLALREAMARVVGAGAAQADSETRREAAEKDVAQATNGAMAAERSWGASCRELARFREEHAGHVKAAETAEHAAISAIEGADADLATQAEATRARQVLEASRARVAVAIASAEARVDSYNSLSAEAETERRVARRDRLSGQRDEVARALAVASAELARAQTAFGVVKQASEGGLVLRQAAAASLQEAESGLAAIRARNDAAVAEAELRRVTAAKSRAVEDEHNRNALARLAVETDDRLGASERQLDTDRQAIRIDGELRIARARAAHSASVQREQAVRVDAAGLALALASEAAENAKRIMDEALGSVSALKVARGSLLAELLALRPPAGDCDAIAARADVRLVRFAAVTDADDPRRAALDPWLDLPVVTEMDLDALLSARGPSEALAAAPLERASSWMEAVRARGDGVWTDPMGVVRAGGGNAAARWRRATEVEFELVGVNDRIVLVERSVDVAREGAKQADVTVEACASALASSRLETVQSLEIDTALRGIGEAVDAVAKADLAVVAAGASARAAIVAWSASERAALERRPVPATMTADREDVLESAESLVIDALVAREIFAAAADAVDQQARALALCSTEVAVAGAGVGASEAELRRLDTEWRSATEDLARVTAAVQASAAAWKETTAFLALCQSEGAVLDAAAVEADLVLDRATAKANESGALRLAAERAAATAAGERLAASGRQDAARVAEEFAEAAFATARGASVAAVARLELATSELGRHAVQLTAWQCEVDRCQVIRADSDAANSLARERWIALRTAFQAAEAALSGDVVRRAETTERVAQEEALLQDAIAEVETLRSTVSDRYQMSLPGLLDRLSRGPVVLEPDPSVADAAVVGDVVIEAVQALVIRSTTDTSDAAIWVGAVREARGALESLGEVNLSALVSFEELSARYADLDAQRSDLERSVADLRTAIARLNRDCRERFREAFDHVDGALRQAYPALVGGGAARLVLEETDDVLDAGVALWVQPPGKRLQHLSLLSGGEKAMAAIALLIALFRYRPAPFCVLDEVDAPLDEANGARFTSILREMARDTQLLLVTHHRRTMEAADVLYGVAMAQPGVSRVVSVRLDGAPNSQPRPLGSR